MSNLTSLNDLHLVLIHFLKEEALGIIISLIIIFIVGWIVSNAATRYVQHEQKKLVIKKWARYITIVFGLLWVIIIYYNFVQKDTPFFLFLIGLFLAAIAISLRDVFSNFVGWLVIISGKGFRSGDRIKIGNVSGDVIDIGLLRTVIAEIGDWVEADQSTGRLISMPNSMVLNHEIINYTQGFDLIWNETKIVVTFESDWKKAESLLHKIGLEDFEEKKEVLHKAVNQVKKMFMLQYNYISPKVYVTIKDSGIELTLRYMVRVRRRRTLEDSVARKVLESFISEPNIEFAYPTIRVFKS